MKKIFLVLIIIFGVGILLAAIGGIIYAVNKDKYTNENFEERTIEESGEVLSLDFEIGYGLLTLYPSRDNKLKIDYLEGDKTKYQYDFKDGKVTFKQETKNNVSFFLFGNEHKSDFYKIAVYVPATLSEELKIDLASGEVKSECDEITVKKLKLKVASGIVDIGKINATEKIEAELASGEIKVAAANTAYLKANIATGSMILDNVVADSIKVKISTGELKLNISDNIKDYSITGKASTGEIIVKNGSEKVVSDKKIKYGNGTKTIDIELSTGDATIRFNK